MSCASICVILFATRNSIWQVNDHSCFILDGSTSTWGADSVSIGKIPRSASKTATNEQPILRPYSPSGLLAPSKGTFSVGRGLGRGKVLRDCAEMDRMGPVWRTFGGVFPPSRRKRETGVSSFRRRGASPEEGLVGPSRSASCVGAEASLFSEPLRGAEHRQKRQCPDARGPGHLR